MKSRARQILEKSIDAIIAAIEVYNKPSFSYREEAFSILAINAWELLLKARILEIDRNRLSAIIGYEKHRKQDGTLSEKLYRKKNRSGNYVSIGLFKAYDRLVNEYGDNIKPVIRKNLKALTEIRDNAIHFLNKDFELRKKVHEVGSANLKNYLNLVRQWFGSDLSQYQLFLMPIAFLRGFGPIYGVSLNKGERNILHYVKSMEKEIDDDISNDFNLSIDINLNICRVSDSASAKVIISNSPDAVPVTLQEEDIRERFPWDYGILTKRLQGRYSDFAINHEYHRIRKGLEKDNRLCNPRYLDPGNPKSSRKNFYNPNILKEFDKHYKRQTRR